MSNKNTISLKEHLAALREADARLRQAEQEALALVREWTKERLSSHNDLLNKWREATERDRANFVSIEAFAALKTSFDVYKEITARALTLAEGKTKGVDGVKTGVSFVAGVALALIAAWVTFKGG